MRFILCKHIRPNTIQLDQPIFTVFLSRRFYHEILKLIQMAYAKDDFDFLNKTVKPIHNK